MKIDLSKLKKGDRVVTGRNRILTFDGLNTNAVYRYVFKDNEGHEYTYQIEGRFYITGIAKDDRDIVQIITTAKEPAKVEFFAVEMISKKDNKTSMQIMTFNEIQTFSKLFVFTRIYELGREMKLTPVESFKIEPKDA